MGGAFPRRGEKILPLALQLFLSGFEGCDPCCNFFPLPSGVVLLFGHAHLFDSCPRPLVAAIGARIRTRRRRIVIGPARSTFAVDKTGAVLVAYAPSR